VQKGGGIRVPLAANKQTNRVEPNRIESNRRLNGSGQNLLANWYCLLVLTDRQRPLTRDRIGIGMGSSASLLSSHIKMIGERRASHICVPKLWRGCGNGGKGIGSDCVRRNSYKQSPLTIWPTRWKRRSMGQRGSKECRGVCSWYADRQPCREPPPVAFACGVGKQESQRALSRFQAGIQFRDSKARPKDDAVQLPPRVLLLHTRKICIIKKINLPL